MPCCPNCAKGGFKDNTTVANHMSQPTSGCNTWVYDLVHIHEALKLAHSDTHNSTTSQTNVPMDINAGDTFQSYFDLAMAFDPPEGQRVGSDDLMEDHFEVQPKLLASWFRDYLYWRDPLECITWLLNHPLFHNQLNFIPHHVYTEWMTGDNAVTDS
ncbi:hypothetical protein BS17DRAFT_770498 [Gyrodon lividus]|nr:hypothetical protein BS17DRAFT_770498 [Gyrodon lividus]